MFAFLLLGWGAHSAHVTAKGLLFTSQGTIKWLTVSLFGVCFERLLTKTNCQRTSCSFVVSKAMQACIILSFRRKSNRENTYRPERSVEHGIPLDQALVLVRSIEQANI